MRFQSCRRIENLVRRGRHSSRNPETKQGGRSCDLQDSFPLPLRLCVWVVVLPFGLALHLLWQTPCLRRPARLDRLAARYRRRLARRSVRVSVPPLRRSSSPGQAGGIAWPAATDEDSDACELVWGEDVYAPFLAGRPVMRQPIGQPLDEHANASPIAGQPNAPRTCAPSSIPRSSLPHPGDRYSSTLAGLRGSFRTRSSS